MGECVVYRPGHVPSRIFAGPAHVHHLKLGSLCNSIVKLIDRHLSDRRDRKSGFCLADHYGHAAGRVRLAPATFFGNCRQFEPRADRVEQGTSVGWTDRYPANFHGQNVELTDVAAGIYVLVHRANPTGRIREVTLANNAASARLRIAWPRGRRSAPTVAVLRLCEGSERCEARR